MASSEEFTRGERERLRATLGVIGDQATVGLSLDPGLADISADPAPRPARARRRVAALAGASALIVAGVGALSAISGRDDGARTVAPAPEVDGAWFVLDLPDASAGAITPVSMTSCCSAQTWLTDDLAGPVFTVYDLAGPLDLFRDVLVRGDEALVASDERGGEFGLWLVAEAGDPADLDHPEWRGTAAIRRRPEPDGTTVYASWSMSPSELMKAIDDYETSGVPTCTCAPRWQPASVEPVAGGSGEMQEITLGASTMRLWRTRTPAIAAVPVETIQQTAADGWPARLIDRSTLVWNVGIDWFRLEQIPTERVDEVVAGLRATGTDETGLTVPQGGDVEGPWFVLNLPGVAASTPSAVSADWVGVRQTWVAVGAEPLLTVTHGQIRPVGEEISTFPEATDDLAGMRLIADEGDPADATEPEWRGNELFWTRSDGRTVGYSSWGMTPSQLVGAVVGYERTGTYECVCAPGGFAAAGPQRHGTLFHEQQITWASVSIRLHRADMPWFNQADAASIEPIAIDGWPGLLIDGTRALWNVEGYWFELSAPADSMSTVLASGRMVGLNGPRPTVPPPTAAPPPTTEAVVQVPGTLQPEWLTDGLWYSLDLPDAVGFQPTVMEALLIEGMVGRSWAAPDASKALVLWSFTSAPAFSTLTGQPAESAGDAEGLRFYATPDDPVTADGAGNEMRWNRADGTIWEFKSFGFSPLELTNTVLAFAETCPAVAVCDLPGLVEITTDDSGATTSQQEITLPGSTMTLTRSMGSPMLPTMFGDVDTWQAAAPTTIGGLSALQVDGTRVVWQANRWRFSLDGIPPDRLDEVLGALRPVVEVVWGTEKAAPPATPEAPSPGWTRLANSPLSPRTRSTVVWTGTEIVVVGGSTFKCPPAADCAFAGDVFSDGATYDPVTGLWRSIAPAPVPFMNAPAVAADGKVYVLVAADRYGYEPPTGRPPMLVYDPLANDWTSVVDAPADLGDSIVAGPVGIVVYHRSEEQPGRDYAFAAATGTWVDLPDDGVGPSYDRTYVALDDGWLAFGSPIIDPVPSEPPVVEYGRFSVVANSWGAPQKTGRRGQQVWRVGDLVMLNPHFANADGGMLDLPSGEWSDLSLPSDGPADVAGVVNANGAVYERWSGSIADLGGARFVEIDLLDDRASASFTTAGRDLFVFGGELWETGRDGRLLGDAWIWRPPA